MEEIDTAERRRAGMRAAQEFLQSASGNTPDTEGRLHISKIHFDIRDLVNAILDAALLPSPTDRKP